MIISLENGKQIEMSLEQYLSISDADFNELVKGDHGHEYSNPFHGSILLSPSTESDEEPDESIDFEEDIE